MNQEHIAAMREQTTHLAGQAETWSHQVALIARNAIEALNEIERQRVTIAELLAACEAALVDERLTNHTDEMLRTAIRKARGD